MSQKEEGPEPHELLNLYIDYYLGEQKEENDELEVRFGTTISFFNKIDFDNIIEKVKSLGFKRIRLKEPTYIKY